MHVFGDGVVSFSDFSEEVLFGCNSRYTIFCTDNVELIVIQYGTV